MAVKDGGLEALAIIREVGNRADEGTTLDNSGVNPGCTIWQDQNHIYQLNHVATRVGYSLNQNNCTDFSDTGLGTIRSDNPDIKLEYYEYWPTLFSLVPEAMHYENSYSSCGGGYCSHDITERDIRQINTGVGE